VGFHESSRSHSVISHRKIAALLIDRGADVNAPFATRDSYTHHIYTNNVFHVAVGKGDTELVKAMLERGAEVDARDRGMSTPLIRAAQANNRELVALLLSRSADVHARDDRGRSALEVTTEVGVADLLLQRGDDRYGRDADGATPLFRISDERIGYAGHLIRSGVDIDARDNSGNTALILQALFLHTRMVRFLLDNGAEIEAFNGYGTTALISSLDKPSDGETALLLIERGADPHHGSKAGHTPLRGAALFGMERVVGALLNHGADPNVADEVGLTPLMWASRHEHTGIVRLLLKNGAAPNARDTLGRLALHWALECQQYTMDIAELLVSNGSVVDEEALSLASKNRLHEFLIPLLGGTRAQGGQQVTGK
jgi:ankyrin repeat protein